MALPLFIAFDTDNTTLTIVLQESKLLTLERKLTRSLALLLLHDLLMQNRGIQASDTWPIKQAVMRHKARLKAEFVKAKIKVGATKDGLIEGAEEGTSLQRPCNILRSMRTVHPLLTTFGSFACASSDV
jgi:putative methyltransferase